MTKILCIETATVNWSVAVFIDGELISIRESNTGGYSHSENLHVYIKEVLAESHLEMKDIDAVVVSRGPGSYTGLRIGVSAAKGLAYAVGVPLIAVDTLRLIALEGRDKMDASLYVPMIDARRMEVYTAVYDSDMCGVKEITASVVDEMTYDFLPDDKTVCFLGDGMKKCREVI
ncbi:MAG: tRNA (adenosine(37)-N6)-threonylcarbamoyltransferase complex dimerization subunit type 1 TsaB, partial [Flavobacteriales bacterium]|nr:tRNA (adenosine(37)-N6)-threonylcarbamoyltransferase complex dimerization subunit type 1 TsaB [Flavobacteriales bacterium]